MVNVPEANTKMQLESCMHREITDAFRQDGRVWVPQCSEHAWATIVCPVILEGVVAPSSSSANPIDCSKLTSLLPLLFEKLLGSEASGSPDASGINQPVISVDSSTNEAGSLRVTVALASKPSLSANELFEVETPLGPMTLRITGLRDTSEIANPNEDVHQGEEEEPQVLLLEIPGEWLEAALLEEAYCGMMVDVDDDLPGYSAPTRWCSWLAQFGLLKQLRVSAHTAGADGRVHLVAEYADIPARKACEKALSSGHLIAVKDSEVVPAAFPRVLSELKSDHESRAKVAWSRLVLLEAEVSQADRALVAEEAAKALPSGPAGRCLAPLLELLLAWIERGTLNATESLRAQLRLQEEKGVTRGAPTNLYRHACWDAALHAALRVPKDSFERDSDRIAMVLCEHWREAYGLCVDPDEEEISALIVALQAVTEARGREERELFETAEAEARNAEEELLKGLAEEEGKMQKSRERLEKKKSKEREKRKEQMLEKKLERQREEERQQALQQAAKEQKEREEEQKRKEREQLPAAEGQNPPRSSSKKSPKSGPKNNATDSPQLELSKSTKDADAELSKSEAETTEERQKGPAPETQSSSSGSPRLSGQPEEEPMPATPSCDDSRSSSSSNASQKIPSKETERSTSECAASNTQDSRTEQASTETKKNSQLNLPATALPRRERWSDAEIIAPPADALHRHMQQNSRHGPLFDAAMKQAGSSSNLPQRHYGAADDVLEAVRKSDEMNRRHRYSPAMMQSQTHSQPQQQPQSYAQPQKPQQGVVVKPPEHMVRRQPVQPLNFCSGGSSPAISIVQTPVNQEGKPSQQGETSPNGVPPSPSRRRRGGRRRGQANSDVNTASGEGTSLLTSAAESGTPRNTQEFRSPNAAITWKDLGGDVMNPMTPVRQTPPAHWMPQPFGMVDDQHIPAQPVVQNPMLGWSCAAAPPAPAPPPPPPPPPPAPQDWYYAEMPYAAHAQLPAGVQWPMNSGDGQMLSPMACGSPLAQMGYASNSPLACQPSGSPNHCQQSPVHCQQLVPPLTPMHHGEATYQWLAGEIASATPMNLAAQLSAVAQTPYED